ncbi:MAG: GNAT family N-acetyltransferase [Nanoarchaeota archaeon]
MDIKLINFDKDFFESLEGNEHILLVESGFYHVILIEEKKAGIVGFFHSKKSKKEGFIQIILAPEFRGKGFLKISEDLLAKKYELKKLYATILNDNIASIKSHLNAGFTYLPEEEQNRLRNLGLLDIDKVRLVKKY